MFTKPFKSILNAATVCVYNLRLMISDKNHTKEMDYIFYEEDELLVKVHILWSFKTKYSGDETVYYLTVYYYLYRLLSCLNKCV